MIGTPRASGRGRRGPCLVTSPWPVEQVVAAREKAGSVRRRMMGANVTKPWDGLYTQAQRSQCRKFFPSED